jgi:hypothetical protein
MRLRITFFALALALALPALPGAAQTPAPAKPPLVGPRALGGQSLYRVVSSTQTPVGSDSSEHVLRIRWKAGQVLTLSLGAAGAPATATVAEYVVPRANDGSFATDKVTPQDPGLQALCVPLEALGDLLKALGAAQGANAWSSIVSVPLLGGPVASATAAPARPAAGCALGSAQALNVPVELTRSASADGSAVLVGSGTTTQQQAPAQSAGQEGEGRQRRGGFGGLGGTFPVGGSRSGNPGGANGQYPRAASSAMTTSVSLSARLAPDGTLLEMTLTKTVSFSFGARSITLNRSVSIDRAG